MRSNKFRIIRQASFTATPWKNGGGITHEALRVPPGGDAFRWRVSVAHVDVSGPFSDFAAYNRTMVLLRGAGLELRFAEGEPRTLRKVGELAQFDGALPTHCRLLNGPCVDLNLMVSKSDTVAVEVRRVAAPLDVRASREETLLVFGIHESIMLESTSGESAPGEGVPGDAVTLEPWDLAVLSGCGARLSRVEPADTVPAYVFMATLSVPDDGAAPGGLC
jgi:hypothetical protein